MSTPTPTPTATPTARELLERQIESYAWVVDGITERYEGYGVSQLRQIASYDLELARLVASYPWVEDDMTEAEWFDLASIRNIAKIDLEVARLAGSQPWVADGTTRFKYDAIKAIERIVREDPDLAKQVFEEPFMEPPFRDRDAFALSGLNGLVSANPPWNLMPLVASQPWFTDGLDDHEAALLKVIGGGAMISDEFQRALIETHYIASASIELPLAGETGLIVVRHTPFPPDDDTLTSMEAGVRAIEAFMGERLPVNDLILVLSEPELWPGAGNVLGSNDAIHMRVKNPRHSRPDRTSYMLCIMRQGTSTCTGVRAGSAKEALTS